MKKKEILILMKYAVTCALYAGISYALPFLSYGAIQIRFGDGLAHLLAYDKRYSIPIILGTAIVNASSPLGIIDMFFGLAASILMCGMACAATAKIKPFWIKHAVITVSWTASMAVIALELMLVYHAPFWLTYATVASGEFIALSIGSIIVQMLGRKVDLSLG